MNYLPKPSSAKYPQSFQAEGQSRPVSLQFLPDNSQDQISYSNGNSMQIAENKTKSNHGNRPRPLVKINKNLQNAFPQNFFSLSKPSKLSKPKQQPFNHKKCFQLQLHPIPTFSTTTHLKNHYQSRQFKRHTLLDSSFTYDTLNSEEIQPRPKIKSIQSLRTSIDKKNNITFSSQKNKEEFLPQTAQTLQNNEEEDIYNVTFGNGFSKQITPNGSSLFLNRQSPKQTSEFKDKDYFKVKNAVSLELKKIEERKSQKLRQQSMELKKRILEEERSGSMSERRQVSSRESSQQRRKIAWKKEDENTFMKIKLDMEEILSKKTPLMFPRVNSHQNKRERISKLGKLVC